MKRMLENCHSHFGILEVKKRVKVLGVTEVAEDTRNWSVLPLRNLEKTKYPRRTPAIHVDRNFRLDSGELGLPRYMG